MHLRSRSRSPGESRNSRGHVSQLPEEVLRHVEFGLVEPSGEDDARLRGEIPFTNVETAKGVISHKPTISSASATTRSINRLHTKSKSNYRPPPPPPASAISGHPQQNMSTRYATNNNHSSETRSEVMMNIERMNNVGHIPSTAQTIVSPSPNVYGKGIIPQQSVQQYSRPGDNANPSHGYYDQQHSSSTPQQFYNPQVLPQYYSENSPNQQSSTPKNQYTRQVNQLQNALPISSVSSSPNALKGMSTPSPITSAMANQYANQNPMEYNTSNNIPFQNSTPIQNQSQFAQNSSSRASSAMPNLSSSYYPGSSNQNGRVYTVNQPRPSPRNIQSQSSVPNHQINYSTATGHGNQQGYGKLTNNNLYNTAANNLPVPPQQYHLQGNSNGMMSKTYQNNDPIGGYSGQINRIPPSYQSPYSANVAATLNQQPQSSHRGSTERLMNTNVNQPSPQTIPTSNVYVPNGNIPSNLYTKGNQGQATDNAYNTGINGIGRPVASSHEPRQLMGKTNYALPVSIYNINHQGAYISQKLSNSFDSSLIYLRLLLSLANRPYSKQWTTCSNKPWGK